jgi:hypothetical protein
MSTDVAALGLSVDSSQVVKGTAALDGLTNAAAKAEAAAENFNTATTATASATSKVSPAASAAARAMEGQASAASNAARAMNTASVAAQRLAANQNVLHGQTGNIAAQFQDIAVQLQAGQSPFTIALQQGTQLSAVLGTVEGGMAGVGRTLLGAFGSLVSPISLVTIGLIAAGGALLQYFTSADDDVEKANAALKKHTDQIKSVATEWADSVPALKSYVDEIERAQKVSDLQSVGGEKIASDLASINAAFDDFISKNQNVVDAIGLAYDATGKSDTSLSKFATSWEDLSAKIRNGTATADDFRKAALLLEPAVTDSGGDLDDFGKQFDMISGRILNAITVLQQFQEQMRNALITTIAVQSHIQDLTTGQINNPDLPDNRFQLPKEGPVPTRRPSDLDNITKEATGNADSAVNKLTESYNKLIQTQQESAQKLSLEFDLLGASVAERNRATAALQAEQALRQQHIDTLSREGQAYIDNAKKLADAATQLERQKAAYQSLQQAGGDMIDTLVGGLSDFSGSWKDTLKNVAQQAIQWFNQIAIANPLKNALTGTNLPTLTDLFSGKPTVPGATTTGSMTVTAGTVSINGAPVGGLPGLPGSNTGGLAGLLGYNAANNNQPAAANQNLPATDVAAYIRQAALQRGIDPNTALAVARSEGGLTSWNRQSDVIMANGQREPSFGPYQLYMNGGLGSQFQRQTGLDPRLEQNGPQAIDFALDNAKQNGWTAFHGAANTGISRWQGINPGVDPQTTNSVNQSLTKMSTSLSSTSKDVSTLGDNSFDAGKSIMDAFKTPGQAPGANSNYFPPAPQAQLPANYFPPAPSPSLSFGGIFQSLFKGIFSLFGFADGGYTGTGGKYQPAGIVHAGEYVVNANATNRFRPMLEEMNKGRDPGARGHGGGDGRPKIRNFDDGRRQKTEVTHTYNITVAGNGDKELMTRMKVAAEGAAKRAAVDHITAYDREHLPNRVRQISGDRWARG